MALSQELEYSFDDDFDRG